MSAVRLMPSGSVNGLPAFRPYTYRGTGTDTLTAFMDRNPVRKPSSRKLKPCGTPGAYKRHQRRGEDICDTCRAAYTASKAAYRARRAA